MRNRVVGARLMKDNTLPYYHHWYPGMPHRYLVELKIDTTHYRRVSLMTASPFFHRAMGPFADYDQAIIEAFFFLLCYVVLFCIIILISLKSNNYVKAALILAFFLFSDAWRQHIFQTQYYFLFGACFFIIALSLRTSKYIIAGLALALLILLRLNAVLFLLPFLLYYKSYIKVLLTCMIGLTVYICIVFFMPFELQNWLEYFVALKEHSDIHAGLMHYPNRNFDVIHLLPQNFEGYDLKAMENIRAAEGLWINPVAVNFKTISRTFISDNRLNAFLYLLMTIGSVMILALIYYKRHKAAIRPDTGKLIYLGLLFYFLSDFFSPIDNAPYVMVQWITVSCLMVMDAEKIPGYAFPVMLSGWITNAHFVPVFPGKHMCSELLFFACALMVIFMSRQHRSAGYEYSKLQAKSLID